MSLDINNSARVFEDSNDDDDGDNQEMKRTIQLREGDDANGLGERKLVTRKSVPIPCPLPRFSHQSLSVHCAHHYVLDIISFFFLFLQIESV